MARKPETVTVGGTTNATATIRGDNLTPAQKALQNNFLSAVRTLKRGLVQTIYYLGEIKAQNIHRMMGFGTIAAYTEATAGLTKRQTKEFLYLARRLPEYPEVSAALARGGLTWTKARDICALTSPADQASWVDAAQRLPQHQLRVAMRSASAKTPQESITGVATNANSQPNKIRPQLRSPGVDSLTTPAQVSKPIPHKHAKPRAPIAEFGRHSVSAPETNHVRLNFSPEQIARWSRLMEVLVKQRREIRENLVLESLECLAHSQVTTTSETRTARPPGYLVVILQCPMCASVKIVTSRGEANADPALLRAGRCDAIVEDETGNRRSAIPPRLRRLNIQNARFCCQAKGCTNTSFLEIHHRTPVARGGSESLENLIVLCWRCHRKLHEADDAARKSLRGMPG